jgi:hypothetical protein
LSPVIWMKLASASSPTLCHEDEEVFFSCDIKEKVLSICTSTPNVQSPYMEYRFGTEKKLEMKVRADATHPKFSRLAVNYASDTATILWFRNADIDYLLNMPAKAGPSLELKKDGKTIGEMSCKNGWKAVVGQPDQPSPFISEKPDANYSDAQKYWQR